MKQYKIREKKGNTLSNHLLNYRQGIKKDIFNGYDDIKWTEKLTNEDEFLSTLERLKETQEPVAFFIDCDSDGVNSGVIYYWGLKDLLNIKKVIICERANGYGIQKQYYDELKELGINYVFSADIGITAKEEVEYGKTLGIESFITDHHNIQEELLPDCVVVDPKFGDEYWYNLAGCGVVYVLLKKFYDRIGVPFDQERRLLHHVTIGTIGDLVPLLGVNRYIVKEGMTDMGRTKSEGIQLILSKSYDKEITTSTVSFGIVPLINSMNRIGNIYNALRFFLTTDDNERVKLCDEILERNELRKLYQHTSITNAKETILRDDIDLDEIMLLDLKAKKSICGLVSSWVTQTTYGKPSIVVSMNEEQTIYGGSGRGCGNFDAMDLIEEIKEYCIKVGGHKHAFGLSFKAENMPIIKEKIAKYSDNNKGAFGYKVEVDKLVELRDVDSSFIEESYVLAPYGMGNPSPLYMTKRIQITSIRDNGRHTFMTVDNISNPFEEISIWDDIRNERTAVLFHNVATDDFSEGDLVDCVFSISKNGSMLLDGMWHSNDEY